jgi:DNA uptake protein ComE-like DNA-binding protein
MANIYLHETVSWKGERYDIGPAEVPDELARALGVLVAPKPDAEVEASPDVDPPTQPKPKETLATSLLEPDPILTDEVMIDGQLNLDAAGLTAAQLAKLPSIGTAGATELLLARPANGFNTFEAFEAIARQIGLGTRIKFDQIRNKVTFA